jgi:hypothetical protein
VILAAEDIPEEALCAAGGDSEHTEAQVDDVDGTSVVEMPTVANGGRHRHLARGGDEVLLDRGHVLNVLGEHGSLTK